MITPNQIRAARALKNWSQTKLSELCGLTTPTIANIELGKQRPSSHSLQKIHAAFDSAGIEFLDGEGVRKKTGTVQIYNGPDGFEKFYQDIDATALELKSGEFLVCNVNERDFIGWMSDEVVNNHYIAINKTSIRYRILIAESDTYMPGNNFKSEYRWTPKNQFYSVPFYVYGDKVAFISFEKQDVNVFVVQNPYFSDLCRRQFREMWARSLKPTVQGEKSLNVKKKTRRKS